MRGTAPLLVTLLGIVFLRELADAAGRARHRADLRRHRRHRVRAPRSHIRAPPPCWALANAAIIAVYTLVDGAGARASGNAAVLRRVAHLPRRRPVPRLDPRAPRPPRPSPTSRAAGGAACSAAPAASAAYGIVLWAMTRAPVAAVAALRETSVLFAALIGALCAEGRLRPARGWPARRASSPASPRSSSDPTPIVRHADAARCSRPTRRVVIVGGGIAGASTAYHLTKLGVTRRRAARAGQAHLRHDLARGGPRRPDARDAQRDADEPLRHRALLVARGGDRPRHRLEAVRQPQRREDARAADADEAADGAREELRHRVRVRLARRGRRASRRSCAPTTSPAPCGFPATARRIPTDLTQSLAKGARMRGARIVEGVKVTGVDVARRPRRRRRAGQHGDDEGTIALRDARQLRRPVGARVRPPRRRQRAALRGRALLHRHRADRRRHARPAGDPRSRRLSSTTRRKSAAS